MAEQQKSDDEYAPFEQKSAPGYVPARVVNADTTILDRDATQDETTRGADAATTEGGDEKPAEGKATESGKTTSTRKTASKTES